MTDMQTTTNKQSGAKRKGSGTNGDSGQAADIAEQIAARGRAAAERAPAVADSARQAIAGAEREIDRLSDLGVVGVLGFTLGVTSGLLLSGAPRVIVAMAAIPMVLTARSAMTRGLRPGRLLD